MAEQFYYYLFNLFVAVPIIVLSLVHDIRIFVYWKQLLYGYLFVSVPFIIWDIWAASEGHWLFSERYITPIRVFGLPIEELLFFVTVPLAMMYVWLVVQKYVLNSLRVSRNVYMTAIGLFAVLVTVVALAGWGNGYTMSAVVSAIIASVVVVRSRLFDSLRFWYFQAALIVLFFISNSFLTALPVILYGPTAIIGLRIGTIPIEDFLFNFSFITLFLCVFNRVKLLTKAV